MKPDSLGTVVSTDHDELEDILKVSHDTGLPVMTHGTIGIGKSQTVRRIAENKSENNDREFVAWNEVGKKKKADVRENPGDYYIFLDIRLSEYEPSDLKGIPDLDSETDAVQWQPPAWALAIAQEEAMGTVFLDEANLAPPSVQKAFYKLVNQRQVGEFAISDDVFICAAGNVAGQDRADVQEMAAPLRDRFLHAHLKIPSAGQDGSWVDWAIKNDIHEAVVSFLGSPAGSENLFNFEDGNKDAKAFATPRAWARVSKLLKEAEEKNMYDPSTMETLASTAIGEGVAKEFSNFLALREEVNFNEYLNDPSKAKELKEDKKFKSRIDLKRAVVTGLAGEYKADTDNLDEIFQIAQHLEVEFGSLMLQLCKEYHPQHFGENIYKLDSAKEISDKYSKIIAK